MQSKLFRIIILLPLAYWIYLIFTSKLGADPAKSLNHKAGEVTLYLIMLNLLVGVLISIQFKFNKYLKFLFINRRYLGVVSFIFLIFHVTFYFVLESFEFKAVEQLYTKNYLIFAMLAFLILFLLALTSNDYFVKKIKFKNWKRLHRFIYVASLLFSLHILSIEKADLKKYGLILAGLWLAQILRFLIQFKNRKLL